MAIGSEDVGRIVFGLFLVFVGVWRGWRALSLGGIPFVFGGVDRTDNPILFWAMICAFVGFIVVGLDIVASGVRHAPSLFESI